MPPADHLAATMHRLYHSGLTTLSGGNLSIRTDDGTIYITPAAIDKGNLTPADIIAVAPSGIANGPHRPSSELPFHRAIYAARPDVRAIVHAHSPALVAFSIARRTPTPTLTPETHALCGDIGYTPYALTGSPKLGHAIAQTFAIGINLTILENHAAIAIGPDLTTAYQRFETLEFAARAEILAARLNTPFATAPPLAPPPDLPRTPTPPTFDPVPVAPFLTVIHRAVQRQLFTSAVGMAALRLTDTDFLITPATADLTALTPVDLVHISPTHLTGQHTPHPLWPVAQAVFTAHPTMNCLLFAASPHILAFALTTTEFDTYTIPESYLLLRDLPRLAPTTPADISSAISPAAPALLLTGHGLLTTGHTPLQAFDRLEVAEFTARSLLDAAALGPLHTIPPTQIADLITAFNLPT